MNRSFLIMAIWLVSLSPMEGAERARSRKRWIASWLVVAAANVVDIHSSRGHMEANPLLRDRSGRFAMGRAIGVKSAITGGFLLSQIWIMRARPEKDYYRPFTLANSVAAAGWGGIAARNYSLRRPAVKTPESRGSEARPGDYE